MECLLTLLEPSSPEGYIVELRSSKIFWSIKLMPMKKVFGQFSWPSIHFQLHYFYCHSRNFGKMTNELRKIQTFMTHDCHIR